MGHDKLGNVFNTNFSLMQHHKWSLTELEAMMPWERYVYIDLLQAYIREEERKRIDQENARKDALSIKRR